MLVSGWGHWEKACPLLVRWSTEDAGEHFQWVNCKLRRRCMCSIVKKRRENKRKKKKKPSILFLVENMQQPIRGPVGQTSQSKATKLGDLVGLHLPTSPTSPPRFYQFHSFPLFSLRCPPLLPLPKWPVDLVMIVV